MFLLVAHLTVILSNVRPIKCAIRSHTYGGLHFEWIILHLHILYILWEGSKISTPHTTNETYFYYSLF